MATPRISYCGLACGECSLYVATQKGDREALCKAAEQYSTPDKNRTAEDMLCDGCTESGRILKFGTECAVRLCGKKRGVENCAYCGDYPCVVLQECWRSLSDPQAKSRLDAAYKHAHVARHQGRFR